MNGEFALLSHNTNYVALQHVEVKPLSSPARSLFKASGTLQSSEHFHIGRCERILLCFDRSTFAEPATGSAVLILFREFCMADEKAIVEIVAIEGEERVPVGIVSVKQALEMPTQDGVKYSHPDHEAGATDVFVTQQELSQLT